MQVPFEKKLNAKIAAQEKKFFHSSVRQLLHRWLYGVNEVILSEFGPSHPHIIRYHTTYNTLAKERKNYIRMSSILYTYIHTYSFLYFFLTVLSTSRIPICISYTFIFFLFFFFFERENENKKKKCKLPALAVFFKATISRPESENERTSTRSRNRKLKIYGYFFLSWKFFAPKNCFFLLERYVYYRDFLVISFRKSPIDGDNV